MKFEEKHRIEMILDFVSYSQKEIILTIVYCTIATFIPNGERQVSFLSYNITIIESLQL